MLRVDPIYVEFFEDIGWMTTYNKEGTGCKMVGLDVGDDPWVAFHLDGRIWDSEAMLEEIRDDE